MSDAATRAHQINAVIDLIIRTMHLHHRIIDKQLEDFDLHRGQRVLLMYLSQHEGPVSQREIASCFDVSPSCIARSMKSLASYGFITRTGVPGDQRKYNIQITEKGRRIVDKTRRCFDHFEQICFQDVIDVEIDHLLRLISKLHENLRSYADETQSPKGSASR